MRKRNRRTPFGADSWDVRLAGLCSADYGLLSDGEGGAAGGAPATPPATGSAASGAPAGAGTTQAGNGDGAGAAGSGQPPADREGFIPRARFDEVNGELQRLRKEREDAEAADLAKKGEFETLAKTEREKREAAESRFLAATRRSAFLEAATGKVSDPVAAYRIALAERMLDEVKMDDDGEPKDRESLAAIVKKLIEQHPILKPEGTTRAFGGNASGAGSSNVDPSKLSPTEKMSMGFAAKR